MLVASNYGHARALAVRAIRSVTTSSAKATAARVVRPLPEGDRRAARSDHARDDAVLRRWRRRPSSHEAASWDVSLRPARSASLPAAGGSVLSTAGPSAASASAFDPIAGADACARVADEAPAGGLAVDFPSPGSGGYTVLGSPTLIADVAVTVPGPPPEHTMLVARLLDVDADRQRAAAGARRAAARQRRASRCSSSTRSASHVPSDHHLQARVPRQRGADHARF